MLCFSVLTDFLHFIFDKLFKRTKNTYKSLCNRITNSLHFLIDASYIFIQIMKNPLLKRKTCFLIQANHGNLSYVISYFQCEPHHICTILWSIFLIIKIWPESSRRDEELKMDTDLAVSPRYQISFSSFHKETVTEMKTYSPYYLFGCHGSGCNGEDLVANMSLCAEYNKQYAV